MNSSECWFGMHENCWDYGMCACSCHIDGFSWTDADVQKFKETVT